MGNKRNETLHFRISAKEVTRCVGGSPATQGHARDAKNRFFDSCLGYAQAGIKKR